MVLFLILIVLIQKEKLNKEIAHKLAQEGIQATVINARFAVPMDEEQLLDCAKKHTVVVTLEENVARGGFGERVSALFMEHQVDVKHIVGALNNCFIEHGEPEILRNLYGLKWNQII